MLVKYVLKNPWIGQLGVSIIYEDLLSTYVELLRSGNYEVGSKECELCERVKYFERIYVDSFAYHASNGDLIKEYASSPSILCRKHFTEIVNRLSGKARDELVCAHIAKLESVIKNLREYIRKQDYRVEEEPTKEEAVAWRVALEIIAGGDTSANIHLSMSSSGEGKKRGMKGIIGALISRKK